jgi:hypothetical protein
MDERTIVRIRTNVYPSRSGFVQKRELYVLKRKSVFLDGFCPILEEASYWLGTAIHRPKPRRVLMALRFMLIDPSLSAKEIIRG